MDPTFSCGFDMGLGDLDRQSFWHTNFYEIEDSADRTSPVALTLDDYRSIESNSYVLPGTGLANYHATSPEGIDDGAYDDFFYRDVSVASTAQLERDGPYRYQSAAGTRHSAVSDSREATPRPSKKLRTAARKAKKQDASSSSSMASNSPEPEPTDKARRARRNHNNVEKQYRNRLNSHFERLIAVLPSTAGEDDDEGGPADPAVDARDCNRRLSKAEVLDLARRHIKVLEMQNDNLKHERETLDESIRRRS